MENNDYFNDFLNGEPSKDDEERKLKEYTQEKKNTVKSL